MIGCDFQNENDAYSVAVTKDSKKLKIRRYKPDEDAFFNMNKQTVLLFPGIACNINQYLTHTPESKKEAYKDIILSESVADWAKRDKYVADDPMRYYSLAHYLWLKGYDVWLANYRGVGRDEYASEMGSLLTNLDVFATLDVPACVDKVIEETGVPPFIGGHSTGGFVCYAYLQGTYIDHTKLGQGYIPHVQSDPALAKERNENKVRGFIGIDPGGKLPFALPLFLFDNYAFYAAISIPFYMDLDVLLGDILNTYLVSTNVISPLIEAAFNTISFFEDTADSIYVPDIMNLFTSVNFWEVRNTNKYIEDYFARYCGASFYMRGFSQFFDMSFNDCVREHWKNGEENKNRLMGPKSGDDDGYYYYDKHMYLMSVPTICLFSEQDSLVQTEVMGEVIMDGKTPHENDETWEIKGSAHADIVVGENAPTDMFIKIGDWLDKVCQKE